MMSILPCEIDRCGASRVEGSLFCAVHRWARRGGWVMVGTRCPKCHRPIVRGEFVLFSDDTDGLTHASCPPPRPSLGRIRDRQKEPIDAIKACGDSCRK